jgi:hypothetical protein
MITRSTETRRRSSAIFQIDGNFGDTASVPEMLPQSYEDMIALLPAWTGSAEDRFRSWTVCARGLEIDLE